MFLAGDIGGTNTRLALFDENRRPNHIRNFDSQKYGGLERMISEYLASAPADPDRGPAFAAAAFGVAGPVEDGPDGPSVRATNLSWGVKRRDLALSLMLPEARVGVINDLAANALGATIVAPDQLIVLQQGQSALGAGAIISAGTGLGVGGLFNDGRRYHPIPSEAGHSSFGPRNDREEGLLRYLREKDRPIFNGHVSWERVLSGPGLFNLFSYLCYAGIERQSLVVPDTAKPGEIAPMITYAGMDGSCPRSAEALNWFVSIYGAAAGNVALSFTALGGLYIGGGIAPKIISKLKGPEFMQAFLAKGPLKESLLSKIPVKVVLDEYTALRGAAEFAARLLTS